MSAARDFGLRAALAVSLVLLALGTAPATAEVVVLGNPTTGSVIVRGNMGGSEGPVAVQIARQQPQPEAWSQLLNDDERGWGAVVCVRLQQGWFFGQISGQPSQADAVSVANAVADKFISRNGGGVNKGLCAPAWNNQGQQISLGPANAAPAVPGAEAARQKQAQADAARNLATEQLGLEKGLRDAVAAGDVALQQYYLGKIHEALQRARQQQLAGPTRTLVRGKLGQTPIGPVPAPILAPRNVPPPPTAAMSDSSQFAEGKVCHRSQGVWNQPCDDDPPATASKPSARGPSGAGSGGSGPGQAGNGRGPGGGGSGGGGAGGQTSPPGSPPHKPGAPGRVAGSSSLVVLLGDVRNGKVILRGGLPNTRAEAEAQANALGGDWRTLIDDDSPGWGHVSCVKTGNGYWFAAVSGMASQQDAIAATQARAKAYARQNQGELVFLCGPNWLNDGKRLAFGGQGVRLVP